MSTPPADVLITVGMGRFAFDRLIVAAAPLCQRWRVIAQTGPSTVRLACLSHDFLPADELDELLATVPIVITHAGNTVRLVQNLGKVPIAVARSAAHGEMADDHQVAYLDHERREGRVIVAEPEAAALGLAVETYSSRSAALLAQRPLPSAIAPTLLADRLDAMVGPLVDRPPRRRRWWSHGFYAPAGPPNPAAGRP